MDSVAFGLRVKLGDGCRCAMIRPRANGQTHSEAFAVIVQIRGRGFRLVKQTQITLFFALLFVAHLFQLCLAIAADQTGAKYEVLIRGATVIDGTGTPAYRSDVAISNGRIAAIGSLNGNEANVSLDATGLV